ERRGGVRAVQGQRRDTRVDPCRGGQRRQHRQSDRDQTQNNSATTRETTHGRPPKFARRTPGSLDHVTCPSLGRSTRNRDVSGKTSVRVPRGRSVPLVLPAVPLAQPFEGLAVDPVGGDRGDPAL